mgnify:CR=1 FL=1
MFRHVIIGAIAACGLANAANANPADIINKPGAATNIGADYVAHAKADGYVIMSADTATLAAT